MAQAKLHSLEMAQFSFGHGQGTRGGPTGEFFPGRTGITATMKGWKFRAVLYCISRQRPHSRQILKLCSRIARTSIVLAAISRREARIALRHFLTGTSWNKCLRKISANRSREKHWAANASLTSPAVGPLEQTLSRWNSLRNKINFGGFLNHGAGEFPPTYPLAPCAVEGQRSRHSRTLQARFAAYSSGQAFAPQRPTGMKAGGGHTPQPSPGSGSAKGEEAWCAPKGIILLSSRQGFPSCSTDNLILPWSLRDE